jgi:hypothetical protein
MVAGIEFTGQTAGGLRGPVADGGRGGVASPRRADVAARERAEVKIASHTHFSLAFQERLFHTAGQWLSSDIAVGRSIRKTSDQTGS